MYVDRGYSYEVNHGARIELTEENMRCMKACCCPSETDKTASKVAVFVMYGGTLAFVGWAVGGPPGAIAGAVIGCTAAVIKIIYNHFQNQNHHR